MRLTGLFDDPTDIHASFDIYLPSEILKFNSFVELKNCPDVPARISRFSLYFSKWDHRISDRNSIRISSGESPLQNRPEVRATGATEAWCAGAVETVSAFVRSRKLWYSWFRSAPFVWSIAISSVFYFGFMFLAIRSHLFDMQSYLSNPAPISTLIFLLLYYMKDHVLPSAMIHTADCEGFFKRYSTELTIAISVVSLVVTVIGLLVGK